MTVTPAFAACLSENHRPRMRNDTAIDARLRLQLLLHPGGIAIPDSYVFSESINGILKKADPWLPHAMQAKLVTVLCRFDAPQTFVGLREQLIPLKLGTAERPEMEHVANKLDGFSKCVSWKPWPTDMGKSYKKLVFNSLVVHPEEIAERMRLRVKSLPFLKALPKFQEILHKAASETSASTGRPDDLRHSKIIQAMSSSYFDRVDITSTPMIYELGLKNNNKNIKSSDMRDFLAILARLYDINFGAHNPVSVDRINYASWIDLFCEVANQASEEKNEDEASAIFELRLPTPAQLLRMSPDDFWHLVEARKQYEMAYSKFLEPGTDVQRSYKRERLRDALVTYCRQIAELVGRDVPPRRYLVKFGRQVREDLQVDWQSAIAKTTSRTVIGLANAAISGGVAPFVFLATRAVGGYVGDVVECLLLGKRSSVEYSVDGKIAIKSG